MIDVISVQNLKKTYRLSKDQGGQKEFNALKGVSFNVQKGEIFGILGPNGAGKTTTLEIIEGLKQQSSGTVTLLGMDNITQRDEIKKRIGVQLQTSDYMPLITLGELLDLFASLYKDTRTNTPGLQRVHANPRKLLELVGLEDKENSEVNKLSGGQKQRFTIATSLVNNPEILFLDEPTTGLDPSARRNLWGLIKKLNAQGITIVLTTHYMEEAEFLCNRVAIMDSGTILEIDEPRKLIEDLSHSTQVSFFTSDPCDTDMFKKLPDVIKVYSHYPKVIIEIRSLEYINAIIETLKKNNISFSGFTVKTATLEDAYLRLTGKEYGE